MAIQNIQKKLNRELKYYSKNQIWNFLDSSDIIGITLENGEIVYINIVSRSYDSRGTLLIFKNLKALGTCVSLFPTNPNNSFEYAYKFILQDCLCLSLEWGNNNKFPNMPHFEENIIKPGYSVLEASDPKDLEIIYQVLLELKKLTGIVKAGDKSLRTNKIYPVINGRGLLNIYDFKNNKANIVRRIVMDYKKEPTPKIIYENDLLVSEFKRVPHYGKWILEILYPPDLAEFDQTFGSFKLRNCLYLFDPDYGYEEFVILNADSKKEPEEFINELARELLDFDKLPTEVMIRDEETFIILEDFLNKINIQVNQVDQLEEMLELEKRIFSTEENPKEPFGDQTLSLEDLMELKDEYGFIPNSGDNPYIRRIEKKLKEIQEEE